MSHLFLIVILSGYLLLLFGVAYWAERHATHPLVKHPYVYVLSLAVYCSAWTYYGSVGVAARSGLDFLPIYLGPVIAMPLWIIVMRRIVKISHQNNITSIADFISLRYGNSRFIGALVTFICLMGIVPYLALQLKALSDSYGILTEQSTLGASAILTDYTFYIALFVAMFASFYGTRRMDASEQHRGLVFSIAFESLIKLFIFLVIGLYVTFYLFDGTTDMYAQMSRLPQFERITQLQGMESGFNWLFTILLSFLAIFLLPRQFQMAVVENEDSEHIKTAIWLFPLYLLLFNIFVVFIAWGGTLKLGDQVNPDYYILFLPLKEGHWGLALLVFIGGLSAIISMVVVATVALSTMISNNLIIPYGFIDRFSAGRPKENARLIKRIRRVSILLIVLAAYIFYITFTTRTSLYSLGLIAFVMIAQLAPAFFFGLYWNRGLSKGAITGMLVGVSIVGYSLIFPFTLAAFSDASNLMANGPYGLSWLRPHALFGLDYLSPPAHAFFWSLFANGLTYVVVSLMVEGHYRERNYAERFVDGSLLGKLQDKALIWKGEAKVVNIKEVLYKFLGVPKTEEALALFFERYELPTTTEEADARLINYAEKLLTGSIGSASARILVANVVKEYELTLPELLEILHESKQTIQNNKALKEQSMALQVLTDQLTKANNSLRIKDQQKDDFLDTVAHELKTPITGIRAATEILIDDLEEMPVALQSNFLTNILNDSDRLARLINNILDFEKLSNGREKLHLAQHDFGQTLTTAFSSVQQIAAKKHIQLIRKTTSSIAYHYDEDRILQVLTNILSNALKFCPVTGGQIEVDYYIKEHFLYVTVADNGNGIAEEDIEYVFQKFYQSTQQTTLKPIGSGLGLAICKHIIERHRGHIQLENQTTGGVRVTFTLPTTV